MRVHSLETSEALRALDRRLKRHGVVGPQAQLGGAGMLPTRLDSPSE